MFAITGCDLYFDDDDGEGDVVCHTPPAQDYRNPDTGMCQPFGGGGYPGCDNPCGPCAGAEDAGTAQPDWPLCFGMCSGLDLASCEATPSCHAAFIADLANSDGEQFWGCWDIAPLPVTSDAYCNGLDAYSCTSADNCRGHYQGTTGGYDAKFAYCSDETGGTLTCKNVDCGFGSHCEEQCYPCDTADGTTCPLYCSPMCVPDQPYSCATVDCGPGYTCVEQCDGMTPPPNPTDPSDPTTNDPPVPGQCYPTCVEIVNAPGECYGDVWCNAAPPACPANTTPGVLNGCYSGYCIPVSQCGPQDPGTCDQAACDAAPPPCPFGSTPGVKNGCYTGYCIPDGQCPNVPCEGVTDEAACVGRMECTPVYTGDDCTCTPNGCTCTTQTFDRCETWWW